MDAKTELIKLASKILQSNGGPSLYLGDHENVPKGKRFPVKWWRYLFEKIDNAQADKTAWAIRIREIADSLPPNKK